MNKNEMLTKMYAPVQGLHLEFNQSWLVSRSVTVAALAVAGVYAVKMGRRWFGEHHVSAEADQMLVAQEADIAKAVGSLLLQPEQ